MQNILVTGGAGYIGSHMVYLLIENGMNPIVLDNFSKSEEYNLNIIKEKFKFDLKIYKASILDDLDKLITENIDAVIHFAGLKNNPESIEIPIEYYDNNLVGTLNILKFCKKRSIKKFVFSSSASVYGSVKENPITEATGTNPQTPYGKSKLFSEDLIKDFYNVYEGGATILRYFNVVGNIESGEIGDNLTAHFAPLARMCMTRFGFRNDKFQVFGSDYPTKDGTPVRDYIHVMDLVEAHLLSLKYLEINSGSEIFNIGTESGSSILEMINGFEKLSETKLDYSMGERRPGDVATTIADTSKALKELGFKSKRSLSDSIASSLKWYGDRFKDVVKI